MSYAKPKAMVIEQTYQSDFMRCFNISLHVICNMHMDYQLQAVIRVAIVSLIFLQD